MRVLAIIALLALLAVADKPMDLPCVTWIPLTSDQDTDPTNLFVAAYTWVIQDGFGDCIEKGDIFPCFASDSGINTWGHHDYQAQDIPSDYCRTYHEGAVYMSNNMYVPQKGPQWSTWKWVLAQAGGVVPLNAIRYGSSVMARSTQNGPGQCCGIGFTGWAIGNPNGTFGDVHFSIVDIPVTTTSFEVAICEAYHPTTTPVPPTPVPPTPVPPTNAPPTPVPPTPVPPTPQPTPSPTLPPNNRPYIRFGHTVPSANNVDAIISQPNATYTWTNYMFGQFSGWVEIFSIGTGKIQIYQNNGGSRGALLLETEIPLTPGPLVVVIKDYWPPINPYNVETIAASYVPVASGSGARLFNLSPDTPSAGMNIGTTTLVDGVKYSLGSVWAPIPVAEATFNIFADGTKQALTSDTFTPPPTPFVFTNFLIGMNNATEGSKFACRAVPLIDAPEH